MSDQYSAIPVKTKGTADVSVRLRNVADSAYMGDNTTPMQVGDGGGSLTIDSPGVPTALGQTTMSASMPVAIASNQSVLSVAGNVASGSADSGNPVKIGGVFNTTLPTLTNGQRGDAQLSAKGTLFTTLADSSGNLVTVTSNRLLVDGSGVTQPVSGTVTVGNSTLAVTQSGTWTVGLTNDPTLVDNAGFTDGTTRVEMAGFILDETAGTALTENDAAAARIDSKRAQVLVIEDATTRGQRATVSAGGAVKVDGSAATQPVSGTVTANQGTAAAGSGAWPMTMTNTSDTVVKPGDSVNNALRVNVVAGGGTTAPSSPQIKFLTISALAISTRTAMNFTEIGTTLVGRLSQLMMASTVACKWELFTVANGTESAAAVVIFFTNVQNPSLIWTPPHPNYVTITATAGADNFRLYATNLDNTSAADVYATAFWDQS